MNKNDFSNINKLKSNEYYYSNEGYLIFTETYHLKRGYCCQNYCKHCPYKHKKNILNGNNKISRRNKRRNSK